MNVAEILRYLPAALIALVCIGVFALAALRIIEANQALTANEGSLLLQKAMASADSPKDPSVELLPKAELKGLAKALAAAGINQSPTLWAFTALAGIAIPSLLCGLLVAPNNGSPAAPVIVSLIVAACLAAALLGYLSSRTHKRAILLERQLAQAELQLAENSRGGLSINRSLLAVMEQSEEPLRGNLRRLYNEVTFSDCTLAEAFKNMADRTGSEDAQLLSSVIAVQQETGANLADALEFLNETITRRIEMRQTLRSSLAETKITRNIVAVVPWAIFLLLSFCPGIKMSGFWEFYTTNPLGWAVLGGCAVAEVLILLLMTRMASLKLD